MLEVNTITDDRQMRALTGLDLATFCALAEPFAAGYQAEADARFSVAQLHQRWDVGGRKGVAASLEQQRLFILFYLTENEPDIRRTWGHLWLASLAPKPANTLIAWPRP